MDQTGTEQSSDSQRTQNLPSERRFTRLYFLGAVILKQLTSIVISIITDS